MNAWQLFCQQVRFICRKELLAIWKDKAFRYVLVIPTWYWGWSLATPLRFWCLLQNVYRFVEG